VRLLVTRPQPDATALAERLAARGHEVIVQPMMHVEFADEPTAPEAPAAILVTSRNAVRALSRWRRADAWRVLPAYTVGAATATAMREAGFDDVHAGPGGVASLVAMVRAAAPAGPILYPAARHRTADLAALLSPLEVVTVEAYRGIAAEALAADVTTAIATGRLDGALFFSRRTAAIFAGLAASAGVAAGLGQTTLFALSPAVAEPLAGLSAAGVVIADRPDEDALLALIPAPA